MKSEFITAFNAIQASAYKNSVDHGFYEGAYNHGEKIALMHSELSEALEGLRKNLMDDHLPHRTMVECELADTIIRIMDYAGHNKLNVAGAIIEKMEYNSKRPYKHGKSF